MTPYPSSLLESTVKERLLASETISMAATPSSTAASVPRNHTGDMADLYGLASTTTPIMTMILPMKDSMAPLEPSRGTRSQGAARTAAVIAVRSAPAPAPHQEHPDQAYQAHPHRARFALVRPHRVHPCSGHSDQAHPHGGEPEDLLMRADG